MLSRRVLNRTLVYQINREEVPPGNDQKGLLEGKPTVQLNRTLGFPDNSEEINSNDFLDGYWESMEMKGRLRTLRR